MMEPKDRQRRKSIYPDIVKCLGKQLTEVHHGRH